MQQGPRLYNALSDEERIARLLKKQQRKNKEVHRVRRNRILASFLVVLLILGGQLSFELMQTQHIRQQVSVNKKQLKKTSVKNKRLNDEVQDLKDPDYLAKLIRYKYYETKPGETIYILPGKVDDQQ